MQNSIEKLIPENLRDSLIIEDSYIAKLGCVPYLTKKTLDDDEYSSSVINEIFSLLRKSPYIMEINPPTLPDPENCNIPLVVWLDDNIFLLQDLKADLRVSLPKRKQVSLIEVIPFEPICPEQFTISFKGFLFLAYSSIDKKGEIHIGQIARELLNEIISESKFLEEIDGLNPTPLLPDLYFIKVKHKQSNNNISENVFSTVNYDGENLIIIDSRPIKQVIDSFFDTVDSAIMQFYESRIIISYREKAIINLSNIRHHMGNLLVEHFRLGKFNRIFSKNSDEIRKTLADIHLSMQNISLLELQLQRISQITSRDINENYFLSNLANNFLNPLHIADLKYDYNIDARMIEFASEETTNSTIAQITLIAAFAGALAGGLLTLLIQFFSK